MRQDDRIDLLGRNRRIAPIALAPFLRPLEETAIDEHLKAVLPRRIARIDQVLGAGDSARGTKKLDIGQMSLPNCNDKTYHRDTEDEKRNPAQKRLLAE